MKTSSTKAVSRFHWAAALVIAAMTAALLPEPNANAATPHKKGTICPPCRTTTLLTYQSEMVDATAEFLLAKAKASSLEAAEERKEATQEALADYKEARQQVREQYYARLAICKMLAECRYDPVIDPADFLTPAQIAAAPNPYFPLVPGRLYRYQNVGDAGTEITEVRVTRETRMIQGVTCIEVRDTVSGPDGLVEDTRDWYAQDKDGNVWYFGELVLNYLNGDIVNLDGSWEAGVDGAKPGIAMKATPKVGDVYRQEYLIGDAEDSARIVALDETVAVIHGTFARCWKIAEFLPFEPDTVEDPPHKYYAPGIGFILELKPDGEREELIAIETF